ncbi:flagellar basal body P-ring protein FlgI [Paracoccus aerodenitrificans]|uniref:flagellar basal body P-ring protein FlgI n=1 Tax=Paracoccus aerodenitrificans TaxID=3017781 RepID=UPI0022F04225|nr:flagellar basal body P-ring protein FlgI [Paracoccus aerodenitrificans]WBU63876.1 flagellar basal body P-ring protein FlgI [Paracoccus aerodenitrificans]
MQLFGTFPAISASVRLKDLVSFDGVRGNDLVGYGLVVGLNGTGDSLRNAPYTEDMMVTLLERLGVNVGSDQFRPKNVAAVMVTAVLPPFARSGSQINVSVSAIGDAQSLMGGILVMTPLSAADGEIYAVAQGSVIAGGIAAQAENASVVQGVPTSGSVPSGARVEREVDFDFSSLRSIRLALKQPDFTTSSRVEHAVNSSGIGKIAEIQDAGTVMLDLSGIQNINPARLLSRIENLTVESDGKARVVVDHRSGTIVMGEDVRVSTVAVSQGNLTLRVQETPLVSQPNPFSEGETVFVKQSVAEITEEAGIGFAEVEATSSLSELVSGLNALGVSARDLIDILKAIDAAGALHAELVVN